KFSLDAYRYIANQAEYILHSYAISIGITAAGTVISLLMTTMLAYPLSRKELPHRNFFSFMVFFTLLFNGGLVPTYLMYVNVFHIKNTFLGLLIPNLLMSGFNVLLARTFFAMNIPDEIIQSASIDGAGEFRIFFSIVMPCSLPILATLGLFVGIGYWNDWYNGLIYVTDPNYFNIQNVLNNMLRNIQFLQNNPGIASSMGRAATNLPAATVRMAIAVVGVIPILIIYPCFQQYFVKGIMIGAVKG
ncbi:MAG: carbohydrate ABC transporter permease, partial [Clostridiales bacterium]|nr:carbohydrate ABC transporter permease [Clostridiales bacterium]